LETIRRCLRLWSNPGEVVLDCFAGIGSTGFVALQFGRKFVGIELKHAYWAVACQNLRYAERESEGLLFDALAQGGADMK